MQLPESKFIIEKIGEVQKTKGDKKFVELILKKNAPKDEMGDSIGEDDLFCVVVWEKNFEKLNGFKPGDRVLAQLYMNGRERLDGNSKIYYAVSFSLRALKHYNPEQQ